MRANIVNESHVPYNSPEGTVYTELARPLLAPPNPFVNAVSNTSLKGGLGLSVDGMNLTNKDLLMQTALFGMLFYVINNDLTRHVLRKIDVIPVEILQTVLFSMIYAGITLCISLK
jgi:hypothetical protein